jgi:hypothetical protein
MYISLKFAKAHRVVIRGMILAIALAFSASAALAAGELARGIVYHDRNGNGHFDAEDQPMPGVRVSNGVEIVKTDAQGRYELPVTDDTTLFVLKPRGYRTPVDENRLPKFYYTHKPKGSPKSRYAGVAPTGPLPASIDFALYAQEEPETFRVVFWADTQPRNREEIYYILRDVVEELVGVEAAFGVTLGDILFDNLHLFDDIIAVTRLVGIPWYNVIGNHDLNHDAKTDSYSDETFERFFGPNYYAFDYGPVHFIVMDTVLWWIPPGADRGKYDGGVDANQLAFIKNDLRDVPKDKLVVLMMHIPLTSGQFRQADRRQLFALLDDRPHTFSISGHTHYQQHEFVRASQGWRGAQPHHHFINATVSGSWWSGAPDELGIPHTTMRDGAPNGYSIITFSGSKYDIAFKAARRPDNHQMLIHTEDVVTTPGGLDVVVNVFGGSERSSVEMRLGETGPWTPLAQFTGKCPYYEQLKAAEKSATPPNGRKLPNIQDTNHLWRGKITDGLKPGSHVLHVRTVDMFGTTYEAARGVVVK